MINSISFPKRGKGYIYRKYDPPGEEPLVTDRRYREDIYDHKTHRFHSRVNKKKFKEEHDHWEQEKKFYDEHEGQYINAGAAKNLIGHTFEFKPGINFIFGPNGSGKTTILRALAGNAVIEDGFSHLISPSDLFFVRSLGSDVKAEHIQAYIDKLKMNSSTVDWSGNPIYYDNFASRQTHGEIGNLIGSVLGNIGEEISWCINKDRISAGQRTTYLLNKVIAKLKTNMSLKDMLEPQAKGERMEQWVKCYELCLDYFQQHSDYDKNAPYTLIFDEMDKSLDVETIIYLYKELLPKIVEKYGCQIITVTHSPILLTPYFRNNPMYHFVDVDPEYSREIEEKMNELYAVH